MNRIYEDLKRRIDALQGEVDTLKVQVARLESKQKTFVTKDNYNADKVAMDAAVQDRIQDSAEANAKANITPARLVNSQVGVAWWIFIQALKVVGVIFLVFVAVVAHHNFYHWWK